MAYGHLIIKIANQQIVDYIFNQGGKNMPKIKTSKAAAKRFKKTGPGKLKRMKAYKSHILTKKSAKRKRNLRKSTTVDATNVKNMKKILPYL